MGGIANSVGGFLGLSDGPDAPKVQRQNNGLSQLNQQNTLYGASTSPLLMHYLEQYANGQGSASDTLSNFGNDKDWDHNYALEPEMINALATNPLTGSKFATDQVNNNSILGGLYGSGADSQLSQAKGKLTDLQNQGFELKPEDQTLYGQESGNIARQFGQQGNQTANSLAQRGLSSSGAAGAQFSGLAGNQNEMLAKAQQQIAQQRFQNTMGQIGQYQNFVSSLGGQAGNAIQNQYGRQAQGAASQREGLAQSAGLQMGQNAGENNADMASANFKVQNAPENAFDMFGPKMTAGVIGGLAGGGGPSQTSPAAKGSGQGFNADSYASSGMAGSKGPSLFGAVL